ncbi:MAG: S8 family peptidase, partial [Blastocatellia bacterium]
MRSNTVTAKVIIALLLTYSFVPVLGQINARAAGRLMNDDAIQTTLGRVSQKLPRDLLSDLVLLPSNSGTRSVIVKMSYGDPAAEKETIRRHGGFLKRRLESIDGWLVQISTSRIQELALELPVSFITPDRQVNGDLDATAKLVGADQLRQQSRSSYGNVYQPVDGAGVGIAVLDSGISQANPDLLLNSRRGLRVVAFKDFIRGGSASVPYDDYGHGSAVAGVAAGSGWASQQKDPWGNSWYPGDYGNFVGIAPAANIISLKVIDSQGIGTASAVIQALDYCIANKQRYNIRVINLSLSAPVLQSYQTDPLCQAAEACVAAGITVVCSAGNYGHNDVVTGYDQQGQPVYQTVYGGIGCPANDPKVITVGAAKDPDESFLSWPNPQTPPASDSTPNSLRRQDVQVASYSSRGPTLVDGLVKPDLLAPGTKVISDNAFGYPTLTAHLLPNAIVPKSSRVAIPGVYCQLTGTSLAAPVVTGTVALMTQANPGLTPRMVKALLRFTAQQLPSLSNTDPSARVLTEGAGLVNSYAAVRLAQNVRPDVANARSAQSLL